MFHEDGQYGSGFIWMWVETGKLHIVHLHHTLEMCIIIKRKIVYFVISLSKRTYSRRPLKPPKQWQPAGGGASLPDDVVIVSI